MNYFCDNMSNPKSWSSKPSRAPPPKRPSAESSVMASQESMTKKSTTISAVKVENEFINDNLLRNISYEGPVLLRITIKWKMGGDFKADMAAIIVVFASRGSKLSKATMKMSDAGKKVVGNLISKYNIKDTGVTLSRSDVIFPRLAAFLRFSAYSSIWLFMDKPI